MSLLLLIIILCPSNLVRLFPTIQQKELTAPTVSKGTAKGDAQSGKTEQQSDAKDIIIPAVILSKPQPKMTKSALEKNITGTVVLRGVLTSKGELINVYVVSGLPEGLTENALKASKLIKIRPPVKNGKSVGMYVRIEYNFIIQGVTVFGHKETMLYYTQDCQNSADFGSQSWQLFASKQEAEAAGYTEAQTKCP